MTTCASPKAISREDGQPGLERAAGCVVPSRQTSPPYEKAALRDKAEALVWFGGCVTNSSRRFSP